MHFYTKICALILWLFRCETCNQNSLGSYRCFHDANQSIFDIFIPLYSKVSKIHSFVDLNCHSQAAICKSIIRIEWFSQIQLHSRKYFIWRRKIVMLKSAKKNNRKSFPMLFNSLQKWNTIVFFLSPSIYGPVCIFHTLYYIVTSPFARITRHIYRHCFLFAEALLC